MPTIHTDNLSFMTWRDFWGKLTNAKDQLEKHTAHSRGNRGYPENGGEFFKNSLRHENLSVLRDTKKGSRIKHNKQAPTKKEQ